MTSRENDTPKLENNQSQIKGMTFRTLRSTNMIEGGKTYYENHRTMVPLNDLGSSTALDQDSLAEVRDN